MPTDVGVIRGEIDYRSGGLQQATVSDLGSYILANFENLGEVMMTDGGYVLINADRQAVESYVESFTGQKMDNTDDRRIADLNEWMDRVFADGDTVYLLVSH